MLAGRLKVARLYSTQLKPAVRALLVKAGDPVIETWTAPYSALAERWAAHDPEAGEAFTAVLSLLPPTEKSCSDVGDMLLALLGRVIGEMPSNGGRV